MPIHSKGLEESRTSAQRMFGKNRITKTGFHQTLDGLGIFRLHYDLRIYADIIEEVIDEHSQHRPSGIEQERDPGQLGNPHRSRLMPPDLAARRPYNHELFVKERNNLQIPFRNRKGNEAEVEAAIMQPGNGLLGHID